MGDLVCLSSNLTASTAGEDGRHVSIHRNHILYANDSTVLRTPSLYHEPPPPHPPPETTSCPPMPLPCFVPDGCSVRPGLGMQGPIMPGRRRFSMGLGAVALGGFHLAR